MRRHGVGDLFQRDLESWGRKLMDFKKNKWIEEKRKSWPEGSLERTLALSGSKSLFDAVLKKKDVNAKPVVTATQSMSDYEVMKQVIKYIEDACFAFDIEVISKEIRDRLAQMPITTQEEALKWRDSWLKEIAVAKASVRETNRESDPVVP